MTDFAVFGFECTDDKTESIILVFFVNTEIIFPETCFKKGGQSLFAVIPRLRRHPERDSSLPGIKIFVSTVRDTFRCLEIDRVAFPGNTGKHPQRKILRDPAVFGFSGGEVGFGRIIVKISGKNQCRIPFLRRTKDRQCCTKRSCIKLFHFLCFLVFLLFAPDKRIGRIEHTSRIIGHFDQIGQILNMTVNKKSSGGTGSQQQVRITGTVNCRHLVVPI